MLALATFAALAHAKADATAGWIWRRYEMVDRLDDGLQLLIVGPNSVIEVCEALSELGLPNGQRA